MLGLWIPLEKAKGGPVPKFVGEARAVQVIFEGAEALGVHVATEADPGINTLRPESPARSKHREGKRPFGEWLINMCEEITHKMASGNLRRDGSCFLPRVPASYHIRVPPLTVRLISTFDLHRHRLTKKKQYSEPVVQ